ncbi:protein translocase subunit SecD [Leptotrichia hongkongensis]|jgi:protein-export membrane protein, secD/secF family|uniref:Protein translocase subunit SecD n=1 Tax=Leptotrichia hongkongensis TaxID=554406 RepID=A0ABV4S645_9FUSO|nr:protein translocase subunit SecD [uncultured Leptotrichia sp.]MDO4638933.1 protein translocase subunit SecD [Leptotrichia hongkongensis]
MQNKKSHYVWLFLVIFVPALILYFNKVKLGLDLRGGTSVVLQAQGKIEPDTMSKVKNIIERRVNSIGVAEPVIQLSGNDKLIVELAGIKDPQKAIELIGTTAKLEFRIKNKDGSYGPVLLEGSALKTAGVSRDQVGMPSVSFELNSQGANTFAKITRENIGKQLAIMLDNKEQSAPTINSEINGGSGIITGRFSIEEANNLANLLKSGALPVEIKIVENRTVGATLGVDSIRQTGIAGLIALGVISVFMIAIYKIPGIVADIALLINGVLVLGLLSGIGAALTLPGIAGFILTLGMAVDSNVITYERIKEELRLGESLHDAVERGYENAFPAIIDGNLTTMLVAAVLFFLGTGPIKGFAVTLALGVVATVITGVFVSKIFLKLFIKTFNIKREQLFWKGALNED